MSVYKGNYPTAFYICANVEGDFSEYYRRLYLAANGGCRYSYGMMVFRRFDDDVVQELCSVVCGKLGRASIIEVHGIAPNALNVGIYTDLEEELENPYLSKSFVARHVGDCRFKRVEDVSL